ncbi:transcriptional regulator with XRE-family HTH domain [Bradyrhizobium japonicum]
MKAVASDVKTAVRSAGGLLRQWRDIRGKTQLDLSFDAGVSQKHISFVESGRSIPSRQMLLDLAQALDVPLRERNELATGRGLCAVIFRSRARCARHDEHQPGPAAHAASA